MIKLVLAGSRAHYDTFLQKLWEKDKPVGDYHYITTLEDLRGFSINCRIVKLGNFREHPDKDRILESARMRFDMTPRRNQIRLDDAPVRYTGDDPVPTTAYDGPMPSTTPSPSPESRWATTTRVSYGQDEAASSEAPQIRTQPPLWENEDNLQDAIARVEALEQQAQEREGLQQATREDSGYQRMNVGYGALP